ncbi:MAG: thioesterase family protein [Pseudolabrys sp.]
MTSFTYRRSFIVPWGDCDPAGIVFNPKFFTYFDTNTWLMFEAATGVKVHDINAHFGIIGIALVDAGASFMKPVKFGDTIEVTSRIAEFRRTSFVVEHRISLDGDLRNEGSETRVWAVKHPDDPDRIKTSAIPAEVIEKFA